MNMTELQALAESWRLKAAKIESKYPPKMYVEIRNVTQAIENCAEELEALLEPQPAIKT